MKTLLTAILISGGITAYASDTSANKKLRFETILGKTLEMPVYEEALIPEKIPAVADGSVVRGFSKKEIADILSRIRKPEAEEPLPLFLN